MQYHPRVAVVTAGRRVVDVDERLLRDSGKALNADFGDANYLEFSLAICQPLTYRVSAGEPLPGRPLVNDRNGRLSRDRKSTRLNSSHLGISYAVFCLKKKKRKYRSQHVPPDHLIANLSPRPAPRRRRTSARTAV